MPPRRKRSDFSYIPCMAAEEPVANYEGLNVFPWRTERKKVPEAKIVPRIISRGDHSYILCIENNTGGEITNFKLEFKTPEAKIIVGENWGNKLD